MKETTAIIITVWIVVSILMGLILGAIFLIDTLPSEKKQKTVDGENRFAYNETGQPIMYDTPTKLSRAILITYAVFFILAMCSTMVLSFSIPEKLLIYL